MKKRRLKAPIDYTLTAITIIQFMLLAADPAPEQMALYIPVQTLNVLTLILNISILRRFSRICSD